MIWFGFLAAAIFVLAVLLWPLFRANDSAAADALSVYRDAMAAAQSDEERAEIEARVLAATAADNAGDDRPLSKLGVGLVAAFVAFVMLGGGFTLYAMIGVPQLDGRPIASVPRPTAPAGESIAGEDAGALSELAGQLFDKLREQGSDAPAEGWMLLARTYLQLGRHADAADAFEQAAARAAGDPEPLMGAGEALVFAAGGTVTDRAKGLFADAALLDPKHPGSRYYLALYAYQQGRMSAAYDAFVALYNDTADDAPWMGQLVARLDEVATASGKPLPEKLVQRVAEARQMARANAPVASPATSPPAAAGNAPGPSREDMEAAQGMSPDDRMGMIQGMVAGLAERLADEPDDLDGWTRLARAYKVLGDIEGYVEATKNVSRLQPNDSAAATAYGEALINLTGNDRVPDQAMAAFNRAVLLDPNNLQALYYRGLGHASRGEKPAARSDLQAVLNALPPQAPVREGVEAALKDLQD
ncbi:MAG: tetratricopeptide repeat protein [Alphaproteobacteria bacterium]